MAWITANQNNWTTSSLNYTPNSVPVDSTPTPFTLENSTGLPLSYPVESNVISVDGVDAGVEIPISVTGVGILYAVSTDNGISWGAATSTSTTVQLGYKVKLITTTSSEYLTPISGTLTIGGVSDDWEAITFAEPVAGESVLDEVDLFMSEFTDAIRPVIKNLFKRLTS